MFNNKGNQKGQALILIAIGLVGLIGLTALAVDGGNAFSDRRMAQNAADNSAIAAALAYTADENYSTAATNLATTNGFTQTNGGPVSVSISETAAPNGACPNGGKDFTVTIISTVDTFFAPIVGISSVTNSVSAKSRACDPSGPSGPLYPNSAVYTTFTGSCSGYHPSIGTSGSSNLQIWGGDMSSASTDPNCVNFKGGEVQMKKAESGTYCGNIVTAANGGDVSHVSFAVSSCKFEKNVSPSPIPADIDMTGKCGAVRTDGTPGTYNGDFPPSGVKTLQPGLYCLNNDFVMNGNGKLDANGVTIYLKGSTSSIKWNGSMEMTIKAASPSNSAAITAGAIPGLVIYAPKGNTETMKLNGNGNVTMQGTQLTAGAFCDYIGSGQLQKQKVQFICSKWQMNGNAQAEIMYDPSVLYSPSPTAFNISLVE